MLSCRGFLRFRRVGLGLCALVGTCYGLDHNGVRTCFCDLCFLCVCFFCYGSVISVLIFKCKDSFFFVEKQLAFGFYVTDV